jgi:hypothetical protein
MAGIILTAAGLGFLGLGAQPPLAEWGAMISAGRRYMMDQLVAGGHARRGHHARQPRLSTCSATACATCFDPRSMKDDDERAQTRCQELWVTFRDARRDGGRGPQRLSFTLGREKLGIVGESGSGKSTVGRAICSNSHPASARIDAKVLRFGDTDLLSRRRKGRCGPFAAAHFDDHAGPEISR